MCFTTHVCAGTSKRDDKISSSVDSAGSKDASTWVFFIKFSHLESWL